MTAAQQATFDRAQQPFFIGPVWGEHPPVWESEGVGRQAAHASEVTAVTRTGQSDLLLSARQSKELTDAHDCPLLLLLELS